MNKTAVLEPYLNFNGNCKQAMEFYKSVLGGELELNMDEKDNTRTIHATLKTPTLSFMASDGHPGSKVIFGDSVHMSIAGTDSEALTKYFNGLAEGGKIDMPLARQFWGDVFGMLTDKFGIHWMVNISSK